MNFFNAGNVTIFIALLLIGHGGFGAFQQKNMLITHFYSAGMSFDIIDPYTFITYFGWFEILLGISIMISLSRVLIIFILIWKVLTELLYIVNGPVFWGILEFIERWGDYGLVLALFYLVGEQNNHGKYRESLFTYSQHKKQLKFTCVIILLIIFIGNAPSLGVGINLTIPAKAIFKPEKDYFGKDARIFPIEELKNGNYVIFFRHAHRNNAGSKKESTEKTQADFDYGCNRITELSKRGIIESKNISKKIESLNLPIETVIASPTCRTQEMAKIMFGDNYITKNELVYIKIRKPTDDPIKFNEYIAQALTKPTTKGKNRVLISHGNVIHKTTTGFKIDIKEGEAFIFKPSNFDGKHLESTFIGKIPLRDWLTK